MIYFMATVLDLVVQQEYPSDMLHVMLAKMNRRIHKLDLIIPDWAGQTQDFVTETMESARSLVVKRWNTVQRSADSAGTFRLAELKKLKPHLNTMLRLPTLQSYLERLHNIELTQRVKKNFDGKCSQRIDGLGSVLPDLNLVNLMPQSEVRVCLMDLELWVSHSLDSWLDRHKKSENSSVKLSRVINWYMSASAAVYTGSPEGFSVMVLILMLLWIALDKAAISHYPLLRKFDPGFPTTLFESLLLPKRHQMGQLRDVEKYLLKRKANSLAGNPSIFGDVSSPSSFGAQYFDRSLIHQQLKARIEDEADHESETKKAELKKAKEQFLRLMAKSNQLDCTNTTKWYGRGRNRELREIHDPHCTKCDLRRQAQSLRISCYEWPLPASESAAKSVVFELDIPSLIRHWRSTIYRILVDVLNPLLLLLKLKERASFSPSIRVL